MKGIHMKYFFSKWMYEDFPTKWTFKMRGKNLNRYKRALKKRIRNKMFKDLDKE